MTEYASKQRLCRLLFERFADILHSSAESHTPYNPLTTSPLLSWLTVRTSKFDAGQAT